MTYSLQSGLIPPPASIASIPSHGLPVATDLHNASRSATKKPVHPVVVTPLPTLHTSVVPATSLHNAPRPSHNPTANLDTLAASVLLLVEPLIIDSCRHELTPVINDYKASPFTAPIITKLQNPYVELQSPELYNKHIAPSDTAKSAIFTLRGAKIHQLQAGQLTVVQRDRLHSWVAVAVSTSLLIAGILTSIFCPAIFTLAVIVSCIAVTALACSAASVIHNYNRADLQDHKTREEIRTELKTASFEYISNHYSFENLLGYDLLERRVEHLSSHGQNEAYATLKNLYATLAKIKGIHSSESDKIDSEYRAGIAPTLKKAEASKQKIAHIIKDKQSWLHVSLAALSLFTQFVQDHHVDKTRFLELVKLKLSLRLDRLSLDEQANVDSLFQSKIASYKKYIDSKHHELNELRLPLLEKLEQLYKEHV